MAENSGAQCRKMRPVNRCVKMALGFREWFVRRNRIIAGYSALVAIGVILVITFMNPDKGEDGRAGCPFWWGKQREKGSSPACRARGCRIVCKDVDWWSLKKQMNGIIEDRCDSQLEIALDFAHTQRGILENGWLSFVDIKVRKLLLRNYPLRSLGDFAFSGRPFASLTELIIENSRLDHLEKFWFGNLATLQNIEVTFEQACPVEDFWIEADWLEAIPTLRALKINQCLHQPAHITNLTGAPMPKLTKIDLSENALRKLPSRSFTNTVNLHELLLSDNMLQEIAPDAFWPTTTLTHLEISNNNLQTLHRDVLKNFHFGNNSLALFGNPWRCDCDLRWLKDLYAGENSPINKIRPLVCANGKRFEDTAFGSCEKLSPLERFINYIWKSTAKCSGTECTVQCDGVPYENLIDSIDIASTNCTGNIQLKLTSIKFPQRRITVDWLKPLSVQVGVLIITKCDFIEMDAGAFAGGPFAGLTVLTMVEITDLRFIRRDWFTNMKALLAFELRYDTSHPAPDFWIELGSFGELYALQTLQLLRCLKTDAHVRNVTGVEAEPMGQLLTFDLGYNALEELGAWAFANAPKLVKLVLNNNYLKVIDKDAFVRTALTYLTISENKLKTLPEGVFAVLDTETAQSKSLFAGGNPWRCDCDLVWFREYFMREGSIVDKTKPPLCTKPPFNFNETDFGACSSTTISTTSTIIPNTSPTKATTEQIQSSTSTAVPSTTTTTTEQIKSSYSTTLDGGNEETSYGTTADLGSNEKTVSVPCRDIVLHPIDARSDVEIKEMTRIEVLVNDHKLDFQFFDRNDDEVTTDVIIEGEIRRYHLLWFNSAAPSEKDCITNLSNQTIHLKYLRRTHTYTFCLILYGSTSVSPYSCFGTKVPEPWTDRSWIQNGRKASAIATFASAVIITGFICSVAMFFVIRQHPNMIKGNKRVIVLGNREESDRNVVPKPRALPLRRYSGYLTPNSPIYEVLDPSRSISSYITTLENPYKIQDAPPLPPCHPVLHKREEQEVDNEKENQSSA